MIDNRVVDISTGQPAELAPYAPLTEHEKMCLSAAEMFHSLEDAFAAIRLLASVDSNAVRSISWKNGFGSKIGLPVVLRGIRRDLDWLEKFYARDPKWQ